MKKSILWVLTVFMAVLIFSFSAQDKTISNSVSKAVATEVITQKDTLTKTAQAPTKTQLTTLNDKLRDLAHFSLYLFLAFFLYLLVKSYRIRYSAVLCVALCVFYAYTDEFHQLFVPGRAFELIDLAKDWSGSFLGMLISAAAVFFTVKLKEKFQKT